MLQHSHASQLYNNLVEAGARTLQPLPHVTWQECAHYKQPLPYVVQSSSSTMKTSDGLGASQLLSASETPSRDTARAGAQALRPALPSRRSESTSTSRGLHSSSVCT